MCRGHSEEDGVLHRFGLRQPEVAGEAFGFARPRRQCGSLGGQVVFPGRHREVRQAQVGDFEGQGREGYLCSGKSYKSVFGVAGQPGNYHAKVLVVDGEVAFAGSSNPTANSLVNGEVVLKVAGSATVATKVVKTAWAEAKLVEAL